MGATRAAQAGLPAAHMHALTCQALPFGLIDPDRAVAALERAGEVIAGNTEGNALHAGARFMAAVLPPLYVTWWAGDLVLFLRPSPWGCPSNERCPSEHPPTVLLLV